MSNARYLEIDSTYRNRNGGTTADGLPVLPGNFVIEISQTGQKTNNNALDPVSDSAPLLSWNSSFRATSASTSVSLHTTPIDLSTTGTTSGRTEFIIVGSDENVFRRPENYYKGAMLTLTTAGNPYYRRIRSYKIIDTPAGGRDQALVTVYSDLPDGVVFTGGTIDLSTNNTSTADAPLLFIPSSPDINNYYAEKLVHNLNTGEYRTITSFDAVTHLATLDGNTTVSWKNGDYNFIICTTRASNSGDITVSDAINTIGGVSADLQAVQLASTASNTDDLYNNMYLRLGKPQTLDGDQPLATNESPYGEQIRISNYTALDGTFSAHGGVGTNTFTLDITSNTDLVGLLITDSTINETREIATYDIVTKSGTVTQNWGAGALGDIFFIRTAELVRAFSDPVLAPGAGNTPGTYEIEQISRDNMVPLNYTGSLVSSSQMVCYEIELLNLVLPNSTLINGGRIAFYPYVYVVLENVSSAGGRAPGLIWSNNPNARKKMFRAVVDDTPTPLISPFIKIDGDGMVQTVKFKPNDSFRFAVFLPDGSLFETVEQDTVSPNVPNKMVQCSAVFSIKKI